MQFVMAGGGTGGHVIPALAVAGELKRRGHTPVFFGTRTGYEARLVPAAGFAIEFIDIGGLNRVGLAQILRTMWLLPASTLRCWMWMGKHRPGAVFSMGGYVAGPVVIAALLRGIPLVAMEPNAVPGLTNRKAARWTAAALINFEETSRYFPEGRSVLAGVPVRQAFFDRAPARQEAGRPFTVLITGGSQGSRTLNHAGRDSWPLFEKAGVPVSILHQAGRNNVSSLGSAPRFVQLTEFIQDMPSAFAEADLIVSRAGASTVSELAAAGKPAVLVPFPFAADDHQRRNAEAMVRAGAARMVDDKEMNGKRLFDEVWRLMQSPAELGGMAEAARRMAKPGAAARAADVLEKVATKSH
ncbi:MAG: undecaprenyldiphospho-muramoylpentapeptide beta-N-acetylglucosaminyltransferase [Bryobacteraceae bacterium]|nr:undecaprenyldiphospho-muramoylpentapeptide beta-N-acetylglucosaminyltransferase [Bryobacteraceae bacterium]